MNYRYLFQDMFNDRVIADIGVDIVKHLKKITPFTIGTKRIADYGRKIIYKNCIELSFNNIPLVLSNDLKSSVFYELERFKINTIRIYKSGIELILRTKKGQENYSYVEYSNLYKLKMVFDAYYNKKLYIKTIY